jgi:hypothetical protein
MNAADRKDPKFDFPAAVAPVAVAPAAEALDDVAPAEDADDFTNYTPRAFSGVVTALRHLEIGGTAHVALQIARPRNGVIGFLVPANEGTVDAFNLGTGQWVTVMYQKDRVVGVSVELDAPAEVARLGNSVVREFERREAVAEVEGNLRVAEDVLPGKFDFEVKAGDDKVVVVTVCEFLNSRGFGNSRTARPVEVAVIGALVESDCIKSLHGYTVRFEPGTPEPAAEETVEPTADGVEPAGAQAA